MGCTEASQSSRDSITTKIAPISDWERTHQAVGLQRQPFRAAARFVRCRDLVDYITATQSRPELPSSCKAQLKDPYRDRREESLLHRETGNRLQIASETFPCPDQTRAGLLGCNPSRNGQPSDPETTRAYSLALDRPAPRLAASHLPRTQCILIDLSKPCTSSYAHFNHRFMITKTMHTTKSDGVATVKQTLFSCCWSANKRRTVAQSPVCNSCINED